MYTDRDINLRHEFLISAFRDARRSGIETVSNYSSNELSILLEDRSFFSSDTALSAQTFITSLLYNSLLASNDDALSVRVPNLIPCRDTFRDLSKLKVDYRSRCIDIANHCMYLDSVWVADPAEALASWIDRRHFPNIAVGVDFSGYSGFANSLQACFAFNDLEPLVKARVVNLYPHSTLFHQRVSKEIFETQRDFTDKEMTESFPDLYVAEGIVFSNFLGTSYMANSQDEWKALQKANIEISKLIGGIDERTVRGIQSIGLPEFSDIHPSDLASARLQEDGFEEIRAALRKIGQEISLHPFDPQFLEEVKRIEKDLIAPELLRLHNGRKFSTRMMEKISSSGIEFSAMALSGVAASGSVLASLAGATTGVLSAAIIRSLVERKAPNPALSLLMRSSRTETSLLDVKRFLLSN